MQAKSAHLLFNLTGCKIELTELQIFSKLRGEFVMTGKEKWQRFLGGEDVGQMVSPLCDKWGTNIPYKWTLPEPEPFREGDSNYILSQQIMMAEIFKWDPLFLAGIDFHPNNNACQVIQTREERGNGITRITSRIQTPYGELTQIQDQNGETLGLVKDYLQDDDDFRKMIWYTEQLMDYDEEDALQQAKKILAAIGDRGMLGTWVGTSAKLMEDIALMFYHVVDYPDEFEALYQARRKLLKKQLATYRKAGFDYLFFVIPGTEWVSPDFFKTWMYDEIGEIITGWRESGGFTLWHTCGLEKVFMEKGYYQELKPDIFETLSEPPVGNLPSLAWGRKQLPPEIITKGNISLDITLNGTPEDVRKQVRYIKESTKGYRHIIGFSDNILDNTPYQNLMAFVDEARKE